MKYRMLVLNITSVEPPETLADHLGAALRIGYVFDPLVNDGKLLRFDDYALAYLVLPETDEEKASLVPLEEPKVGEYDDVNSIKDVSPNEADQWLSQGYKVQAIFSKNVILVKHKDVEEAVNRVNKALSHRETQ